MDWSALQLSLQLAALTVAVLLPLGIALGRWLAFSEFRGKGVVEAALTLPLVLPPTVLGYYLLSGMSSRSPLGQAYVSLVGHPLAFTFEGLLVASVIVNLPFAIQPIQRSFEAIGPEIHDAAACCGLSGWRTLWRIELPLAWPGVLGATVMTFAHTLGEFGVVLMVGGSIPGQTRTIAISIYDRMQSFDDQAAGAMAGLLLAVSLVAITLSFVAGRRVGRPRARR
ncbi:MAG: molybdate ABC transporter permease subunit [Roseateles sp.]